MATWDELPLDLVRQVLARLPAAAVQRFRAVCRTWLHIIDDVDLGPDASGQFLSMWRRFRRRRPAMPLYFVRRNFSQGSRGPEEHQGIARVGLHALDLLAREAVPLLRFADVPSPEDEELGVFPLDMDGDLANPGSAFLIEASCEGVLILSYSEMSYICNPATALWASLPPADHGEVIVGFYARDPPGGGATRQFHVLYVASSSQESEASYWIRELEALPDDSIYEIGRPMSPEDPELRRLILAPLPPARQAPPILVRGILYWAPSDSSHRGIVLFDPDSENFRLITAPTQITRGFRVLDLNGQLAIAGNNSSRTSIEIWVEQDQVKEPWGLRYTVDLPERALTQSFGYDPFCPPSVYFIGDEVHVLLPTLYTILHWTTGPARQLYQYRRPNHWVILTRHTFEENFERNSLNFEQNSFLLGPRENDDDDDNGSDDDDEPPFMPAAGMEERRTG